MGIAEFLEFLYLCTRKLIMQEFMWKKYSFLCLALVLVMQVQAQKQDDMRQAVEYLASQELGASPNNCFIIYNLNNSSEGRTYGSGSFGWDSLLDNQLHVLGPYHE